MNKSSALLGGDVLFCVLGVLSSVAWHFLWGGVFSPVFLSTASRPAATQAVYAGAILREADFFVPARKDGAVSTFGVQETGRGSRSGKIDSFSPKPVVGLGDGSLEQEPGSTAPRVPPAITTDLAFGPKDYETYLFQADFSDLRRALSREDLGRAIVFRVYLSDDGRVKEMTKIAGSGDPLLDLFIQSKIDNSVFKPHAVARGCWVTVRFKLR